MIGSFNLSRVVYEDGTPGYKTVELLATLNGTPKEFVSYYTRKNPIFNHKEEDELDNVVVATEREGRQQREEEIEDASVVEE